jgi:FlaA1/EpsC-like NDP-sugar epimerase
MVLFALGNHWGGELWVPKIPSYRILDLAKAIAPECKIENVGIRPGEKIHEEMITEADSFSTVDTGKYYAILPQVPNWNRDEFMKHFSAKPVAQGFKYNSGENTEWETVESLREKIRKYVDLTFTV